MTRLVRLYLKTAVAFLLAGLTLGARMLVLREFSNVYPSAHMVSAHTHAIAVGFVMMMILGVALWMFPRPVKDDTQYKPNLAWTAYWFVSLGTAGRLAGELLRAQYSGMAVRWLVVVCGFAQICGLVVYFYTMWPRIRAVGSNIREARGERF